MIERSRPTTGAGYELPLLLLSGFRTLIDALHEELAKQGHPDVRPVYGFAMQAVGPNGATVTEIGRRLGVSKQAAAKTVVRLEQLGYVTRIDHPGDARSKLVVLSDRGRDALRRSAVIFDSLHGEWESKLGSRRLRQLEADLRSLTPAGFPLDAASWLGT